MSTFLSFIGGPLDGSAHGLVDGGPRPSHYIAVSAHGMREPARTKDGSKCDCGVCCRLIFDVEESRVLEMVNGGNTVYVFGFAAPKGSDEHEVYLERSLYSWLTSAGEYADYVQGYVSRLES